MLKLLHGSDLLEDKFLSFLAEIVFKNLNGIFLVGFFVESKLDFTGTT
jgi:hypothetical protein